MSITRFTVSLYTWTVVYSVNTLTLRRSLHRITLLAFDYLYFQSSLHDLTSVTKTVFCSLELEAFEKDLANAAVSFPMFSLSAFSSKEGESHSLKIHQRTWTIFLEDSESETELQGHEVPAENARRSWQQNSWIDLLNAACHRICYALVIVIEVFGTDIHDISTQM